MQLKDLPNDRIKATMAEFFLRGLWYHVQRLKPLSSKSKVLRHVCIIDEAHRLSYKTSPFHIMIQEARKYGLGVIVSSQLPEHVRRTVIDNSAVFTTFGYPNKVQCRYVANIIGCEPYEILALKTQGEAVIKFDSQRKLIRIRIVPRWERD